MKGVTQFKMDVMTKQYKRIEMTVKHAPVVCHDSRPHCALVKSQVWSFDELSKFIFELLISLLLLKK